MRAALILLPLITILLATLAGCGAGPTPVTPRACAVLGDADIEAALHQTPSSVGGGDAGGQSTCVWALPNQAGGTLSALLIGCTSSTSCAATFTSMAPLPRFSEVTGVGNGARISTRANAADGLVIQGAAAVLALRVDNVDVDPRAALLELGRRAATHLP